ncbi:MAG: hypothetical protein ACI8RY_001839, partial [Urechidicola sp.]
NESMNPILKNNVIVTPHLDSIDSLVPENTENINLK